MERRRKITELQLLVLPCFALQIHASSKKDVDAIFYEPFDESFEVRWIVSAEDEYKVTRVFGNLNKSQTLIPFETEKPEFEAIAVIGIEIWTMQDGILFDNILIADDEKVAESYRITKRKPKFDAEKEKQKAEDSAGGLFSSFLRDLIAVIFIFLTVLFRFLLYGKKPAV